VSVRAIWSNPITRGITQSAPMRFAGGILSKAFSLPAALVYEELFQHNPWGDKNSPMYGKGPGSLEYAAALENANAAGRNRVIEEDYLITPAVEGSTFTPTTTTDLTTNSNANETAEALKKYGFNENFALKPTSDGNYSVVRSETGKKADAFLDAKTAWLADTANSPAARAGIDPDARWKTYLGNQAWRKDRGRSYNTDLDAYLKPSSENKRHWNVFGNQVVMGDNKPSVKEDFKLPGEFPGTKAEFDAKYGTGKEDYTVGQKVTAFLNNQSPETRYGVGNYGGDRIPQEQKTTIMSPLEQEMYW